MGPITLSYDIVKFFTGWYKGEDRQAESRARKLIWAVERVALSAFVFYWMSGKHAYIASYRVKDIPQPVQDLLLNDFRTMGLGMVCLFPETRVGWGSWLIKQGALQIANVIMSRREGQPAKSDHFLYGILHISFGLFWFWMYNSEKPPYLNELGIMPTLEHKAIQVLKSITT